MNELLFRTGGDWDSTTLHSNGFEIPAAQLFVELRAGRDDYGDPIAGGIRTGAELQAFVRPQDRPDEPHDLLPGRLTFQFAHQPAELILENPHPQIDPAVTRVWFNGDDVSERVVDLLVDINALDDTVAAYLTLYKSRWFRRDEVTTHVFLP
jgi:hypothetical protein